MLKLNLGCGNDIRDDWTNVDMVEGTGVDVVWDLDVHPWPFDSLTYDRIMAYDLFEHVDKPIAFMVACHRILTDGGMLHLRTPHYLAQHAYTDPTHKRFPTEHTFDYWIPGTLLHQHHNHFYGAVSFEKIALEINHGQIFVTLRKNGGSS